MMITTSVMERFYKKALPRGLEKIAGRLGRKGEKWQRPKVVA